MKSAIGLVLILILAVVVVGGCAGYKGYRQVIVMDEDVKNQWAQVENQLQRRYDLIPNLVETVKGIAGQEQKVFGDIAEARTRYGSATNQREKTEAANQVESALSRLLVIVEQYPELRSNESFLKLQDQLEGTENRLSVERQRYNDAVRDLNRYIRPFPGSLYASFAGVQPAEYFKPTPGSETPPKVDFTPAKTSWHRNFDMLQNTALNDNTATSVGMIEHVCI